MNLRTLFIGVMLTASVAASARAEPMYISRAHAIGCTSEDYYKKITNMVAQNDREAFGKTLSVGLATGACIQFKQGEPVFIEEPGILTIKIRRQGDTAEYYTGSDAVSAR